MTLPELSPTQWWRWLGPGTSLHIAGAAAFHFAATAETRPGLECTPASYRRSAEKWGWLEAGAVFDQDRCAMRWDAGWAGPLCRLFATIVRIGGVFLGVKMSKSGTDTCYTVHNVRDIYLQCIWYWYIWYNINKCVF